MRGVVSHTDQPVPRSILEDDEPMRVLLAKAVCLLVVASVLLAPPVSAHPDDDGSYFYDENGEWTQEGCHETVFSGRHCHEAEGLEDTDTQLLVAGAVAAGILIWRAARRKGKQNARQASSDGEELPQATLEDLMRREAIRFDLLPVQNSLGKIDGAQFRLSFRF